MIDLVIDEGNRPQYFLNILSTFYYTKNFCIKVLFSKYMLKIFFNRKIDRERLISCTAAFSKCDFIRDHALRG